jgi:hypothetical protein
VRDTPDPDIGSGNPQETLPSGGLSENPSISSAATAKSIRDGIGIDPRLIFKGGSAARIVLTAFRRSTNMATGNLSSITERYRREVSEYDARCANRPHDPALPQERAGDTVLPRCLSIEFWPGAGGSPLAGQSIGTKIVWRGLSPDDLVMWPLPVVSSTKTISSAPIWRKHAILP